MERISTHQFMTLGASVLLGGTFLILASFVTEAGGRDGWMAVLPGMAVTIPYALMVLSLSAQYPQENLLQISEKILGKWIGKIIGLIYISLSGYYGGLLLALLGTTYEQSIMPFTPRWVFYLGGFMLAFYLVSSGVEVFARFSEVIFPVIVISLLLNIALTTPMIGPGALMPILSEGLSPLLPAALSVMPFPMTYILFLAGILTFLPTDQKELGQLRTAVWRGVFLVGILQTLIVLIQLLVFGPVETVRLSFGILELGKIVEIGRTVTGIESIFMGVWLGALVIRIAAFFFMTLWGLETVFNLKGLKWRLAMSVVFLGVAFGFMSGPTLRQEISFVEMYVIFPFGSIWIPALWGVSLFKKKAVGP